MPDPLSPTGKLAEALRNGRRLRGLSYAKLAERVRIYSAATLQRAASGTRVPKRDVVRAFAHECGLDVTKTDRLWLDAYRKRSRDPGGGARAPQPRLVRDFPDLGAALEELWKDSGAPSYRMMEERARAAGLRLSRTTANRISSRRHRPATPDRLQAFLIGCGLPERTHSVWLEAWTRAQSHDDTARQLIAHEVRQVAMAVADRPDGKVSQEAAVRLLRKADFLPLERYRGFETPWTVECARCAATLRVRLSDVLLQHAACKECPAFGGLVRQAWGDLLKNASGALTRRELRALRAATVLQARMRRNHLDVPVFVADKTTEAVLQDPAWHPAFEEVLRRHVRRPFRLDVLLVYNYDTMPSHRNGQRYRRLAKAAGLVDGPVDAPQRDPDDAAASAAAPRAAIAPAEPKTSTVPSRAAASAEALPPPPPYGSEPVGDPPAPRAPYAPRTDDGERPSTTLAPSNSGP